MFTLFDCNGPYTFHQAARSFAIIARCAMPHDDILIAFSSGRDATTATPAVRHRSSAA
jgi:hypothetical protein